MQKTIKIIISGQVQGVGFRPFVYSLAKQFQLCGTVCNNQDGVLIHINASEKKLKDFSVQLLTNAPAIALIRSHSISEISFQEYDDFKIIHSTTDHQINIPLTPDFAICESCKEDIKDQNNRRFGYAFTSCTNCGPRYSVTTKFPFERGNTTLSAFQMCATCLQEYTNANDRRFHAQTNSCPDCGIQLKLTKANGRQIALSQSETIKKVAEYILQGNLVALKSINGYLLCCDANNTPAIERLRSKKQRPSKPFALLYPSIEKIKNDFATNLSEERALLSSVAPIVVLNPKTRITHLAQERIAPGLNQLGVLLPSSALLALLMDELKIPIIATSGNIHGSPIISTETDAVQKLSKVTDYFLHHNLEVSFPQDDSVFRFAGEHQITLRRSRGLAPNYLNGSHSRGKRVLAMGAHLKSTFTFRPNAHIYVSPYFGNLENYDVLERYQNSIRQYQALFETHPKVVLIDLHPQFQSSILGREIAEKRNAELIPIQHHKAHFASVLGEHGLFESKEKILGVVWDGTGLGEDNAIWGGEFFSYQNHEIERLTHFEYVDWLAADKMSKEPRLSLLSMLPESEKHIAKDKFSENEYKIYNKMLESNTLKTSSIGRLFDAVASLLIHIDVVTYEGEAALLLENQARNYQGSDYIDFLSGIEYQTIPTKIIIQNVHEAILEGLPASQIANSFIHTLALVIPKVARQQKFRYIACSGGVFQNTVLIEKLLQLAENSEFQLKFNRILSSNDENISLGQLWYNQHIKN